MFHVKQRPFSVCAALIDWATHQCGAMFHVKHRTALSTEGDGMPAVTKPVTPEPTTP
jgi:hypothetical protein